jgi:hypothetical protein
MNTITPASGRSTLRALWQRAPLWRFFVLLGPFLTVVFLLFPPRAQTPGPDLKTGADAQASYTPPSAAGPAPASSPVVAPAKPDTAAAPPGAAGVPAPTPAPPQQIAQAAPPRSPPPSAPQTAQLSMVTAGPAQAPNETGLDNAMLGPLYSGSINSNGFTLPLPPGKWAILSRSSVKTPTAAGMAYYLGRIEHKRLIGAVKFFAVRSNTQPGDGFPQAGCARPSPLRSHVFIEGEMAPKISQACWIIENYYAAGFQYWADKGVRMSSLDRAAGGDLTAKGVTYPQDLIEVRFTRSDQSNLMEADYLFSPDAEGITSRTAPSVNDSDWTAANVQRSPERVAYIAKMKSWGEAFWPRFKNAFTQGANVQTAPSQGASVEAK